MEKQGLVTNLGMELTQHTRNTLLTPPLPPNLPSLLNTTPHLLPRPLTTRPIHKNHHSARATLPQLPRPHPRQSAVLILHNALRNNLLISLPLLPCLRALRASLHCLNNLSSIPLHPLLRRHTRIELHALHSAATQLFHEQCAYAIFAGVEGYIGDEEAAIGVWFRERGRVRFHVNVVLCVCVGGRGAGEGRECEREDGEVGDGFWRRRGGFLLFGGGHGDWRIAL